jgi:phospholipase/carboxylesterase
MNPDAVSSTLVQALRGFEGALRRLNPLAIPQLREELLLQMPSLAAARESLLADDQNTGNERGREELLSAGEIITDAIKNFGKEEDLQEAFLSVLRAARKYCQAQEAIFTLCGIFPSVNGYFLEPEAAPAIIPAGHSPGYETGIFHAGTDQDPYARGGYVLYIPETYIPERAWPMIVALHGGYGHGRDFIWTWLREARTRGFVLLTPTSLERTWSITNVEADGQQLSRHLEEVCSRINIDRGRILLTGMSDGGTFALSMGLSPGCPYQAIVPVSCTLPPVDMRQAKGKRLLWIHGAQDWMFPVSRTLQACKELLQAGADIKLKIVHDLSHAYPREENDTILKWFVR